MVRAADEPLTLTSGSSEPGSAVIVAGPVTVSVPVEASHVALLEVSQEGSAAEAGAATKAGVAVALTAARGDPVRRT